MEIVLCMFEIWEIASVLIEIVYRNQEMFEQDVICKIIWSFTMKRIEWLGVWGRKTTFKGLSWHFALHYHGIGRTGSRKHQNKQKNKLKKDVNCLF